MANPKQFLKEDFRKKKASKQVQVPETADEYQAIGVDHEEAGEKWRGGDAAKSVRFFQRAIDTYNEGLKKFPNNFDLAYNKSRVQYEMTQHPKLRSQLPGSMTDLLIEARDSCLYAWSLKQDDTDCIFNTAQCLTSVAEELDELDQPSEQIVQPLIQSVEMFKKCLELQTKALDDFKQFEASASAQPSTDSASMDMDTDTEFGSVALPQPSSSPASSEQWATIKEPITAETLVDTITSLLETLTLLVSKITTTTDLHPISVLTNDLSTLFTRFSPTLPLSTHYEARTTNAQYEAAFADAEFRCGVKTFEHANQILRAIYKELPTCRPGLETPNPRRLAEEAEAWMNFQTSLRLSIPNTPEEQMRQIKVRWDALSQALACFSSAMKQKDVENLARIHMTRGDAEMQRWMIRTLADYPQSVAPDVMLKNAGVFYRGAKKVSEMSLDLEEKRLWRDAGAKAEIVMMILETGGLKGVEERLQGMVREMDDEGLIEAKTLL